MTVRDQQSEGNSGMTAAAATTTTATNNTGENANRSSLDSNLKTLIEFKQNLLQEQRRSEEEIQELSARIEEAKKRIDENRNELESLRVQLKHINEQKDVEYAKFKELKNTLAETRNGMKNMDDKGASSPSSRRDRFDVMRLSRALQQIEHDIQTKKLSKDEERRLVSRSKEVATKLHNLKVINKKEDKYRNILFQYDTLKSVMNKIFDQKSGLGKRIGVIKVELDRLVNLREDLYEERRKVVHTLKEATAKLEMAETQLSAIEFRRSRAQAIGRQRRHREHEGRREISHEAAQERVRRSKENQERWNILKEEALKKMSSGEKLTFEEMKLIYGENSP